MKHLILFIVVGCFCFVSISIVNAQNRKRQPQPQKKVSQTQPRAKMPTASVLAIGQFEIKTATGVSSGLIVKEPILIIKESDHFLNVYPVTPDVIKSIGGGKIEFRNERAAHFSIEKSASPAEINEMLIAIEKATTTEQMNAVLSRYKPKLRWEEMFANPPSMLELFKNESLDKDWRIVKATPLKLADPNGKVTARVDVKDIVGFTKLQN